MSFAKTKFTAGFTLVELLVTISIFVLLTGIVLFNQTKFNSTILLTNLAYDTALTIRQAQTYGVNVKEFNRQDGVDKKFLPYGVHFETESNNKSFILFTELDYGSANDPGDGLYLTEVDDDIADSSLCQADKGCVTRYSIKRGNYISAICAEEVESGESNCSDGSKNRTVLDIVFTRPNPDARISFDNSESESGVEKVATIILSGVEGDSSRKVIIRSNGLIEIIN
ncbi:MAG: prepilin-type N-terminal cleavage/methylation domain-containing protein [Candidatus Magasanikbacteria bacterium]